MNPMTYAPAREAALLAIARYEETTRRLAAMEAHSGRDYPAASEAEADGLWDACFNLAAREASDAEEALIEAILIVNGFDRFDVMHTDRKVWPVSAIRHGGRVYLVVHNRDHNEDLPEDAPIEAEDRDRSRIFVLDAARVVDLADAD